MFLVELLNDDYGVQEGTVFLAFFYLIPMG